MQMVGWPTPPPPHTHTHIHTLTPVRSKLRDATGWHVYVRGLSHGENNDRLQSPMQKRMITISESEFSCVWIWTRIAFRYTVYRLCHFVLDWQCVCVFQSSLDVDLDLLGH